MGQKMDPHGLRVGVIKDWDSKCYANKNITGRGPETNAYRDKVVVL